MKKSLTLAICFIALQLSCQDAIVQKDTRKGAGATGAATGTGNQAPASGATVLHLTWDASTGTTTDYHVYGLTEEKNSGGTEFASMTVSDANKAAPAADIDLSKTTLPKTGKVCFYVVAENADVSSEASAPVCMIL